MASTDTPQDCKIGLALSGGGFRAALFALGSLWRLNDLGVLATLDRVTSVSGGSITAGYLGLVWSQLQFVGGVAENFREVVAAPIQRFCRRHIDSPAILAGLLLPGVSAPGRVARAYERELYHHPDGRQATLQDLPADGKGPRFVLYATSLQTGSSVRFSRPYLGDYRLGRLMSPSIRLATAVAASSAFPPVLSPVVVETDTGRWTDQPASTGSDALRARMVLTDGGVYDNMGLETVWDRCDTVLVSDAGAPFRTQSSPWRLWPFQLGRVRDIAIEQTRALRKRMVVEEFRSGRRHGTYWGITTQIGDYVLSTAMTKDSELTSSLQRLRTRLAPVSDADQSHLINWAYALCDAAMRRYVVPDAPPGRWPYPEHAV